MKRIKPSKDTAAQSPDDHRRNFVQVPMMSRPIPLPKVRIAGEQKEDGSSL